MTEFVAKRMTLSVLADRAGAVVPSSKVRPVLASLRIDVTADPGMITVTGTDLELTMVTGTRAVQVKSPGTLLLPAARLRALLKEAPEGDVTVSVKTDAAKRPIARLSVASPGGRRVSWDLRLAAEAFPEVPEFDDSDFVPAGRAATAAAIRTVRHAVSSNPGSPAYACVSIIPDVVADADGNYRTVVSAYDMARAQQAEIAHRVESGRPVGPGVPFPVALSALGSPRAVDEVLRLLASTDDIEHVLVAQSDRAVAFRLGSSTLMTARMMARPADSARMIHRALVSSTCSLTLVRDDLARAVARVRITADPATPVIGLRLEPGKVTVLSQDTDGNRAEDWLPAVWEHPERLLLVHADFLTGMLSAHPSVQCHFAIAPEESGKRKSVLVLRDPSGVVGMIPQMASEAARLGYS